MVSRWQLFLRGQSFASVVNGQYDAATVEATKAFQTRYRLDVDGKVGNETYGQAGKLGFELADFAGGQDHFPALPPFGTLASNKARQAVFGPLAFEPAPTPSNPEAIKITNDWVAKQLVTIVIPELIGIPGAPASGKVSVHRMAALQTASLWKAWKAAGLLPLVLRFDGLWNPRFIRGGAEKQILSNHAFGSAFDINAKWNPRGAQPALEGEEGCVYRLVPLAHEHGFYWGGHFSVRDGMHFEVAQVQA
jgi:hypothetical protein